MAAPVNLDFSLSRPEVGGLRAEVGAGLRSPTSALFSLLSSGRGLYDVRMSTKSAKVAALVAQFRGRDLDPHYLGYFECFNRRLFYEAHEVLEELWLGQRQGPNALFYKGLIQLAGAFVHLQKSRPQPAAALFRKPRRFRRPFDFMNGLLPT